MRKLFLLLAVIFTAVAATAVETVATATAARAETSSESVNMVRLTKYEGLKIAKLSIHSGFDVELIASSSTSVVVEIPAELEKYLIFELDSKNKLTIGFNPNNAMRNFADKFRKAKIYTNDIESIDCSAGVNINCVGEFRGTNASVKINGGCQLTGFNLENIGLAEYSTNGGSRFEGVTHSKELIFMVTGGSSANISHYGQQATINVSGGSRLDGSSDAPDLQIITSGGSKAAMNQQGEAKRVKLDISGASMVDCHSSAEQVTATVIASSTLNFGGENKLARFDISSASRVNITGRAENCEINTSSSSNFSGEDYHIGKARLISLSASKIKIGFVNELNAQSSSASSIRYKGVPAIIYIESSSASTIKSY